MPFIPMTDKANYPETIKLEVPADVKYLETVAMVLQSVIERMDGRSKDALAEFGIKLAVHEACSNIIEHAYHGQPGQIQIEIHVSHSPSKIVVVLSDQGDAADESSFVPPNLEEPQVKGYGLYLMKQLLDQVDYSRSGETNQWILVKTM